MVGRSIGSKNVGAMLKCRPQVIIPSGLACRYPTFATNGSISSAAPSASIASRDAGAAHDHF